MKVDPIIEAIYFPTFLGHHPLPFTGHSPIGGVFRFDAPKPTPLPLLKTPEQDTFLRNK